MNFVSRGKTVLYSSMERVGISKPAWTQRVGEEITFWDDWFAAKGLNWPDDFINRQDPEFPIQSEVLDVIDPVPGSEIHILDVGAGPLTSLGKKIPGCILQITATDALAKQYDALLEKYRIVPLVRTIEVEAERLSKAFPPDYFDFVHARNCLDHSHDPVRAIQEIVSVLKPGKRALLIHRLNEAKLRNYQGLHQWNFDIDVQGRFTISSKRALRDIGLALGKSATVTTKMIPDMPYVILEKLAWEPARELL